VSTVYEAGHRVVATARNVASLSYIPDESNVLKLKIDVTSRVDITNALSAAVERFGRVDVIVNNAGYAVMGDTESVPESDARLQMETPFWCPVFITPEAVRIFRETNPPNQGGKIIQISSIGGLITFPGSAFYQAR
jgi:NADP-dependent 3-hydroxy acid dehydrogenase YdfG